MKTPKINENTDISIAKSVPDAGAVSYSIRADDEPVVECASPEHAHAIQGAMQHGGNSYGRERLARQILSKAAGTDFWDGNAIWLNRGEFQSLVNARGVPDELRAKLAAKLRERDEEHSSTFGGEPPPEDDEPTSALAKSESVKDLKQRLLDGEGEE